MTIKVALAGAGAFGIKHLDGIKLIDGVEVVSLVGRELAKTQDEFRTVAANPLRWQRLWLQMCSKVRRVRTVLMLHCQGKISVNFKGA